MSAPKRWWMILAVAVVMLAAPSCSENNLDDSDADVILVVLGINNPEIQGDTGGAGTCSGDPTIVCLDNQDCVDQSAGFCDFPGGACTINEWSVQVQNSPLNPAGAESPFNDIVVSSVTLSYLEQDGVTPYAPDSTVPLSETIQAGTLGSIEFAPLSFDDLTTDDITVDVFMSFAAQTVSGNAVTISGGTGAQLFIEDCIP